MITFNKKFLRICYGALFFPATKKDYEEQRPLPTTRSLRAVDAFADKSF